jgi:hypothetical protein
VSQTPKSWNSASKVSRAWGNCSRLVPVAGRACKPHEDPQLLSWLPGSSNVHIQGSRSLFTCSSNGPHWSHPHPGTLCPLSFYICTGSQFPSYLTGPSSISMLSGLLMLEGPKLGPWPPSIFCLYLLPWWFLQPGDSKYHVCAHDSSKAVSAVPCTPGCVSTSVFHISAGNVRAIANSTCPRLNSYDPSPSFSMPVDGNCSLPRTQVKTLAPS